MKYKIRQIKYSNASTSIQVYTIENRRRVILRHIGTARNEQEKENLIILANDYIQKISQQLNLYEEKNSSKILYLDQTEFLGIHYSFLYELLSKLIFGIGLDKMRNKLLLDLVIMRLIEPASKVRSLELIEEYFGIKHRRQNYYEYAPQWLMLKSKTEKIALNYVKKNYAFNFDLLFYDVTTLYFETFEEDELRKNGFSKDNKPQQPQIVVALMVTKEGVPITYEVFAGNTFEGHTILPVVKQFISKNKVNTFTIVADAAMISTDNIKALRENKINYIVGARLGNLSFEKIVQIDGDLPREDGSSIRINTENGYLICSYSAKRYRKDKYEMEKQITRAKYVIDNPSKNKKLKYTKSDGDHIELNHKLIEKNKMLLGIKGYYTNLEKEIMDDHAVIERYSELYKIEQAFRISKNDLQTRPIFHMKEEPIKLHLLICFMALIISKHIELQTNMSIKKFIHECKKITDANLKNKITGKVYKIRTHLNTNIVDLLQKLNC